MSLPSQFSLEEDNFYKDIQNLVKKCSQNEKELSSFLQRYIDLLARMDLDDESFVINFAKAGFIVEASTKVYGTKVDRLWNNLEHVLESLKNKNQNKKNKPDDNDEGDDVDLYGGCDEEGKKKLPTSRRRKKVGDSLFSPDDFVEIDNWTGLLDKNMNEPCVKTENKLKLCEKVPNIFIKNKTKKKKMDLCLSKCAEDKDVIRLRDWIVTGEGLLVKEVYSSIPDSYAEDLGEEEIKDLNCNPEVLSNVSEVLESIEKNLRTSENFGNERNNNTQNNIIVMESTTGMEIDHDVLSPEGVENFVEHLNISKESDLAKFPNVKNHVSEDCLVDIDEDFGSSSKFQDLIPSKRLKSGNTNKLPCQLCNDKKTHKKKGNKCIEEKKIGCLDVYFTPYVQPQLSEPQFGILPDKELFNVFKVEMKVIEHLGKVNACRNINEAYHPDEHPEEDLKNFLGFDVFENLLKKVPELQDDEEILEENLLQEQWDEGNDNIAEDVVMPEKEFELPFPVTESRDKTNFLAEKDLRNNEDDNLNDPESEYQKLVNKELKDHYAAKDSFAKNKALGLEISKWHELIADKIKLSQKRGALNVNVLADKIMQAFPTCSNGVNPTLPFQDLVKNQNCRDIPRYFFACLQLTNEGNLNITKSNSMSLATDCMVVTRLKATRTVCDLEDGH